MDTETKMVNPLPVVPTSDFKSRFDKFMEELGIDKIVIGITGGKIDEEVKQFGQMAGKNWGLPVEYFDETLTSQDAQKLLLESGAKRIKRKNKEDAIAAALMLQYYLEGGGGKNV